MFENTTRWPATGGKFKILKSPNLLQCLQRKIRIIVGIRYIAMFHNTEDCTQGRYISIIEATQYFAIFASTTRLPATGENLSYWSLQFFCNVCKYKIASNGWNFKLLLLYLSDILQCFSTHQACRQRRKFQLLKPPNILQYLRTQQDCRILQTQAENLN